MHSTYCSVWKLVILKFMNSPSPLNLHCQLGLHSQKYPFHGHGNYKSKHSIKNKNKNEPMHQLQPTCVSTCFNCWASLRTMNLHHHKMVIMFILGNGVPMTSCNCNVFMIPQL